MKVHLGFLANDGARMSYVGQLPSGHEMSESTPAMEKLPVKSSRSGAAYLDGTDFKGISGNS
ncbi:MAG: hypothetical protein FJ276_32290 [Planctomycetes bacterium]|nr:hypothetical protein [Planctomycetota bacterium]